MTVHLTKLTLIFATFIFSISIHATSLRDSIEHAINLNPDIVAEHYNKKESKLDIEKEEADYYPTLNLKGYIEDSTIESNYKDETPDNTLDQDGWNATVTLEQILYDGGKTSKEVEKYRHKYYNTKHTSKEAIEDIILETTNTYLDLLLNQTLEAYGTYKLKAHKYYLQLAQEKEDISGEILDRLQVQSKINSLIDNQLEQEVKKQKAMSSYERLTGNIIKGNICQPILNENIIPSNIEDAIFDAINNNNKIQAQYELVQEKKATISIQKANFLPDLKLELQSEWDKDISLEENGEEKTYSARLQSSWNLYNGGKDSASLEKEKIAMLKERKILDAIKNDVRDEIKGAYNTYFQLKKRIENLKEYVDINNQIVSVYREQLKEGSRTFLDLLNAENEVFRTKVLLAEEEINQFKEYYSILKALNKLSDSILSQKNVTCQEFDSSKVLPNYDDFYKNQDDELEETAKELGLEE